jgi:hypothetical protein
VPEPRRVAVPFARLEGWVGRYEAAHPGTEWQVDATVVSAAGPDGGQARIDVPFRPLDDLSMAGLFAHLDRPWDIGILLVRRGGFAVARVVGPDVVASKVGRRHVQGRSKAGGWSQQRFARRRAQQARVAFDAAAENVERLLLPAVRRLDVLVTGGDRRAVDAVLDRPVLAPVAALPGRWLGPVPDPRREVLDRAVASARSVSVAIIDPEGQRP